MRGLWLAVLSLAAIVVALTKLLGATHDLSVTTLDIAGTPATIYRPLDGKPAPAVVIAHGFAGSRELMQPFAITLARNGYVAITFDFLGHGKNPHPLRGSITEAGGATKALVDQLDTIVAYAPRRAGRRRPRRAARPFHGLRHRGARGHGAPRHIGHRRRLDVRARPHRDGAARPAGDRRRAGAAGAQGPGAQGGGDGHARPRRAGHDLRQFRRRHGASSLVLRRRRAHRRALQPGVDARGARLAGRRLRPPRLGISRGARALARVAVPRPRGAGAAGARPVAVGVGGAARRRTALAPPRAGGGRPGDPDAVGPVEGARPTSYRCYSATISPPISWSTGC